MEGPHHEPRVERIIREAHEAGEFDDLPGFGAPIPHLDRFYESDWWTRAWMEEQRRSDAVAAMAARLRRELPRLLAGSDPTSARDGLSGLNDEIAVVNAGLPAEDRLPLLDIDALLAERS